MIEAFDVQNYYRETRFSEVVVLSEAGCGLFGEFGGEGFDAGEVLEQVGGDVVACAEVGRGVVGDPGGAVFGLCDEDLERQVDGAGGCGEHDGRASLRVAEEEEFGGAHGEADAGRFAAVIDEREELDAFGGEDAGEGGYGCVDGVRAVEDGQAVVRMRIHVGCSFVERSGWMRYVPDGRML